jgi:hypothetical protein
MRIEARDGQARAGANQGQVTRSGQRTHGDAGAKPRARDELLPRSSRSLCGLRLHRAGSIDQSNRRFANAT